MNISIIDIIFVVWKLCNLLCAAKVQIIFKLTAKLSINYKNTDIMIFSDELYVELGEEVLKQVDGNNSRFFGVVELSCGRFEFIFGFEYMDNALQRWMDIGFDCGVRCSTDFSIELLKKWLQNTNRK